MGVAPPPPAGRAVVVLRHPPQRARMRRALPRLVCMRWASRRSCDVARRHQRLRLLQEVELIVAKQLPYD